MLEAKFKNGARYIKSKHFVPSRTRFPHKPSADRRILSKDRQENLVETGFRFCHPHKLVYNRK
jgi:hypothetical protein